MRAIPQRIGLVNVLRQLHSSVSCPRPRRWLHLTAPVALPRRRHFFTSNLFLARQPAADESKPAPARGTDSAPVPASAVRKPSRAASAKTSLRRVAIIAQHPKRESAAARPPPPAPRDLDDPSATVSAVCVAEAFDMPRVLDMLASHGFAIDPDRAGFDAAEVVHAKGVNGVDIFVFPSGTIVTWALPPDVVTRQLLRAAHAPHPPHLREVEHLDFAVDTAKAESTVKGDLIVLGTRREHTEGDTLDTTLAKIAFASGLARSTKLAVLESALTLYFESTRNVPELLSRGAGVPLGRRFIQQKSGELLSLRARLNHYSELTDSLPDIFWDSRAELGLEGYYDQVGRALDVNVRIRTLNQKMDYAQEIASVLREMSSEQHSTRLEIIIIVLIAVEVFFELLRIYLERYQNTAAVDGQVRPAT